MMKIFRLFHLKFFFLLPFYLKDLFLWFLRDFILCWSNYIWFVINFKELFWNIISRNFFNFVGKSALSTIKKDTLNTYFLRTVFSECWEKQILNIGERRHILSNRYRSRNVLATVDKKIADNIIDYGNQPCALRKSLLPTATVTRRFVTVDWLRVC